MLTGKPSTVMARSVPWSRLKPRKKYWLALPSPECWVTINPRHDFQRLADPRERLRVDLLAGDGFCTGSPGLEAGTVQRGARRRDAVGSGRGRLGRAAGLQMSCR